MTRHLHHAGTGVAVRHLAQVALNADCVGRGVARWNATAAKLVGNRAEQADVAPVRLEAAAQQVRGRRLAVCAGDPNYSDGARWIAIVKPRGISECGARVRHHHHGHGNGQRFFSNHRNRATRNSLLRKANAVFVHAFDGKEDIAWPHFCGMECQSVHREIPVAEHFTRPQAVPQFAEPHTTLAGRESGWESQICHYRPT